MLEGFTKRQQLFSGPKITPKFTSPQQDESLENFTIDEIKDDAPSQEKVFNLNQIQKYNQNIQNKGQIVINAPNGTEKIPLQTNINSQVSSNLKLNQNIQNPQNAEINNNNTYNINNQITNNINSNKFIRKEQKRLTKKKLTKQTEIKNRNSQQQHILNNNLEQQHYWWGIWFGVFTNVTKFVYRLKNKYMTNDIFKMNDNEFSLINDISADKKNIQLKIDQKLIIIQTRNRAKNIISLVPLRKASFNTVSTKLTNLKYKLEKYLPIYDNELKFSENWNLYNIWFSLVNTLLFLALLVDIGKQFVTSFYDQGILCQDRIQIAKKYLKTYFVKDFITALSLIFSFASEYILLIFLVRLFFLRQIKLLQRLGNSFQIAIIFGKLFIYLHFFTCAWYALGKSESQETTWLNQINNKQDKIHTYLSTYTENLRDLTNYLTENQVNQDLQSSAKKFLEYIHQDVRKKLGAEHNLRNLSHSLKTKIIIDVFMKYVQNVPIFDYYFSNPLFQEALCCRVSEQIYGPDEIIKEAKRPQVPSIYIIMKGKVQLYLPDATNQKRSTTHLEYKKDYSIFGEVEFFTQQFDSLCSAKSIGVTQILAINLYDFLDLLKDFPRENEVYCYLKDSLVFTNQFDKIDLYCHACNSHKHTLTNCHEVFYEKKNDRIIRNYEKNLHSQINKFKRSQKRKKHNPVLNSAHNESVIFKLVQKLQDEQQTTYYYDDSYYSSDDTYEYDEYDEDEYVQNDHGVKSISRINTAPQQDMNTNFDKRSQKKKYTGDSKKFEPDNMTIKSKSQKRQTSFRSIISGKSLRSIKSQKSIKSSLKQSQFQESVVRQQSNSSHRFKAPQFYRASMSEIEQQNSLKNAYQNQYQVKPRVYTLSSYDDRNNNNNSNQVRPFNPDNFQGLSEVVVSQKNRQRGFSGFSLISRVSSTSQYIAPSPLFLPSQAVQIEYESDPQKSWFEEGRGTNGTKKSQDPQRHYVQENQNFDQLVDQLTEKMTDKYGYDNNLSIVDERFQFESQHNFNFYHPKGNANLDMKSPFYQPNRRKIM
ncbi:Cyclic nucleotide-binding protein [Pseudocohnilembus persalinus]|uniref:Cyclic nucleotide-binding protein n=1 Tax=Pseudocohnilembus persalinus TaxID=266149 RepID=A0A0V0QDR5_PSEPJ|nr:Cyclic nucleotide-binding protein [Pseudocohnilembus persalinus]|eukprot:KRX00343.1 Cyclic nucleotide-binding protein [Pseudocohnilembus persalinus]